MLTTEMDSLQEIDGIGPKCEQALHAAGIRTYRQIAEMTAVDLATICENVRGMHAGRIETEDWVGQAKKLAAEADDSAAQYYAVFTVRYLLTADRAVRRTELSYLQQQPDAPPIPPWSGWQPQKLLDTMMAQAQIVVPDAEDVEAQAAEPDADATAVSETREAEMAQDLAKLAQDDAPLKLVVDIAPDNTGNTRHRLAADAPLTVAAQLVAGTDDTAVAPPFTYRLTYFAKCMQTGEKRPLGHISGKVVQMPAALAPVSLPVSTLKPDLYRLLVEGEVKAGRQVVATSSEGRLVRVA